MAKNEEPSAQIAADSTAIASTEEQNSGLPPAIAQTEAENPPPYEDDFSSIGEADAENSPIPPEDSKMNQRAKSEESDLKYKTNDANPNDDIPANIFMGKLTLTPIVIAGNTLPNKKMSSAPAEPKNRGVMENRAADTISVYDRGDNVDGNVSKPTYDGSLAKAKIKAKSSASKEYIISLMQSGFGPPHLTIISSVGNQTAVTLWNAGSTDILLFELNKQLYLQLGDQYYFYPQTAPVGVKQSLTPVTNATLFNTLRNR
jgi:hypothetical protein